MFLLCIYLTLTHAITLKEAYQASLVKTETVPIEENRTEQRDEKISQAIGNIFPSLSFSASYLRRDVSNLAITAFSREEDVTARLTATQPLFRGLAEWRALSALNHSYEAQKHFTEQAKISLYGQVTSSFYDVLSFQKEIENLKALYSLSEQRVRDLKKRTEIGRSRKGEYLSSQAQVALVEGQLEAASANLSQAKKKFTFITGLSEPLNLSISSEFKVPSQVPTLESYLTLVEKRGYIAALKNQIAALEETKKAAWAGHFPSMDAVGNYYLKRTGNLENSHWDVGITLTLPLFQGGTIQSSIREASLKIKEGELSLAQARRLIEKDVRTLYENFISLKSQIESLKKALTITEENYREQNHDWKLGLVTNLEVIQAMNSFQETKQKLDIAQLQYESTYILLETSVGKIL